MIPHLKNTLNTMNKAKEDKLFVVIDKMINPEYKSSVHTNTISSTLNTRNAKEFIKNIFKRSSEKD